MSCFHLRRGRRRRRPNGGGSNASALVMLPFLLLLSGLALVNGDSNALDVNALATGRDDPSSHSLFNLRRGSGGTADVSTAMRVLSSSRRLKGKHAADADADDEETAGAKDSDDKKEVAKKGGKDAKDDTDADANDKAEDNDKTGEKDTATAADDKADTDGGQPAQDDLPPANPPPRTDESPCVGATTCADCRDVAKSVADVTQMKSTCAWTSGICSEVVMVSGSGREVDDFDCDGAGGGPGGIGPGGQEQQVLHDQDQDGVGSTSKAASSSSSKYADGDDYYDDYDSGSGVGGILFMMAFFAGMFYYAKTKLLIPGGGLDALARGRSFASGGGADGDDDASTLMGLTWATGLTSRSGGDGRNAEMVPLSAATDDDEWGWEDGGGGGGDIEQQSRAEHLARVKEEEDLHTALAMSLSDPSNNKSIGGTGSGSGAKSKTSLTRGGSSNSGPKGRSKRGAGRGSAGSRPQRSGSGSVSASGGSGFSRSHSGGSAGSGVRQSVQSEAVPSSPTMGAQKNHTRGSSASSASAAPSVAAAAAATAKQAPVPGSAEDIAELLAASRPSYVPESNYISSLSKPKVPPPKKKVEKKKSTEEDDIFASMGLSSAPKFASSSSSSSARPPVRKAAAASTRPTSSSTTAAAATAKTTSLAATSEDMGDADWDEDSDLDDLLDD